MDEATRNQALDVIMAIVAVSALAIGLISMAIGKITAWRDARSVNHSQPIMSPSPVQTTTDQQTPEAGIKAPVSVSVPVSGTDTGDFDLAAVPSDLTYEEVVTILAGQVTPAGKPAYSGKKIYTLVGGNYNEFTALMRRLRTKDNEPAEPPPATTPIAGRPTRAVFKETDPELAYQPPE
jgi:hypothetical protein